MKMIRNAIGTVINSTDGGGGDEADDADVRAERVEHALQEPRQDAAHPADDQRDRHRDEQEQQRQEDLARRRQPAPTAW